MSSASHSKARFHETPARIRHPVAISISFLTLENNHCESDDEHQMGETCFLTLVETLQV